MDVRRGWSRKDYTGCPKSFDATCFCYDASPKCTPNRHVRPATIGETFLSTSSFFSSPSRFFPPRREPPFHFFNLVFLNFFFSLSLPPLFPFLFLLSRNGKRSQGISRGEGYRAWWNVPRAVSSWIIRFQFRLEVAAVGENRDGEMIRCSSLWELEREREKMCPRWGRAANFFDSLTSPYDFLIPPYSFFLSFFFLNTLYS